MSKIALITGANKGIGLETARQLARDHGFTVLVGARDTGRGDDATKELQDAGLDAHFLLIDPTDAASIQSAVKEVADKYGHLDVLINNAGTVTDVERNTAPSMVPTDAIRETYELNVFGLHEVTRAFWPLLEKSAAARLVNVSSGGGSLTFQSDFDGPLKDYRFIGYASSKAAVNMMTIQYASQWQNTPHRANTVHPGNVATDLNPGGDLSVEEGAKSSVMMATIPDDGPNGTFTQMGETLPW